MSQFQPLLINRYYNIYRYANPNPYPYLFCENKGENLSSNSSERVLKFSYLVLF